MLNFILIFFKESIFQAFPNAVPQDNFVRKRSFSFCGGKAKKKIWRWFRIRGWGEWNFSLLVSFCIYFGLFFITCFNYVVVPWHCPYVFWVITNFDYSSVSIPVFSRHFVIWIKFWIFSILSLLCILLNSFTLCLLKNCFKKGVKYILINILFL